MHYIRFLKPPSVSSSERQHIQITAKITITSDLGETFLYADLPLRAVIQDSSGTSLRPNQQYTWKAGVRQLELVLQIPIGTARTLKEPCYLIVSPASIAVCVWNLQNILPNPEQPSHGKVFPVRSDELFFKSKVTAPARNGPRRVLRRLQLDREVDNLIDIWEETGESIARHIWDAGLVLSALLHALSNQESQALGTQQLPRLQALLSRPHLNVLELGAGCGIVGITLVKCFASSNVTLTDLPDAEEIAEYNVKSALTVSGGSSGSKLRYQNLDWSESLAEDLVDSEKPIDLVLVSDCTYNPDVAPDLVSTLSSLVYSRKTLKSDPQPSESTASNTLILLAMKIRHDSERIFFDLMTEKHLQVLDRLVLPLPHLGEEDQEIEIYLFSGTERRGP